MTKERKAQVVTIAILLATLALILARTNGWRAGVAPRSAPPPETTPQDAIYAMLDAARSGDVNAYLASYAGQLEASLRQSLQETTATGFARYLKDSNSSIKGIAISEPQPLSARETKVRVEYVYQDRNEAQTVYLEKLGGNWKITRVDGVEPVKTLVPYGTPVQ